MPKANLPTVTPTHDDWVRMAAYLDGEGYIGIVLHSKRKATMLSPRYVLAMTVSNTDPRLPQWCRERFGGNIRIQKPSRARLREKICYHWKAEARIARKILEGCLEYFILKREQAEVALAFQKLVAPANGNRPSGSTRWERLTPAEL